MPVDAQLLEWTSSQGGRALRLVVKMTFEGYLPPALCPVTRCWPLGHSHAFPRSEDIVAPCQ